MAHYICTGGCEGVSEEPGACQTQDCPNFEMDLVECDCEDGNHDGMLNAGA